MSKQIWVYDVETFPNLFTGTFKCIKTGKVLVYEISERKNDVDELIEFLKTPEIKLCGYNSLHFDDLVLNFIIKHHQKIKYSLSVVSCAEIYDLAQQIIKDDDYSYKKYKYGPIKSIDLMTMLFSKAMRKPLKLLQASMKFYNIQEMPFEHYEFIKCEDIDKIIAYNINDVDSTEALLKLNIGELQLRMYLSNKYNRDLLSKDGVNIGIEVIENLIHQETGLSKKELEEYKDTTTKIVVKDIIVPEIKFKSPQFNKLLDDFKNTVIHADNKKDKFAYRVIFDNIIHTYGKGGIHSENRPVTYKTTDKVKIIDLDVALVWRN